jgi:uncharacterized protein (TIGR00369 family)
VDEGGLAAPTITERPRRRPLGKPLVPYRKQHDTQVPTPEATPHRGADGRAAGPLWCAAVPDDRVAWLNEFFRLKVPGMFGCEITNVSPERAEGRLTVTEPLIAGTGFLFAPVVIGMADFLCAAAIGPHLPDGASFTTIEVKTNFVSSAREGDVVTGEAHPVHLGRTTQVWDATVTNATTGRLMALFRNTQLVLLPRQ